MLGCSSHGGFGLGDNIAYLLTKLRIYVADFPCLAGFHGPEAANLACLMQLWLRQGVQVFLSFRFSWPVTSTPKGLGRQGHLPTISPHLDTLWFLQEGS